MNSLPRALVLSALVLQPASAATAQDDAVAARVMRAVRAAVTPALPFPNSDEAGALPEGGNTTALWMVRPFQPGDRAIEVLSNPLNEQNQIRAERAMKQIDQAITAAQRRSQVQYERALAEATRTGRSQDVDGITLSDEGVAGARIDADSHVTIEVAFNRPSYRYTIASAVEPSPTRPIAVAGAVAVITVPPNVYRDDRDEERYCEAETQIYLGQVAVPTIDRQGGSRHDVTAPATPADGARVTSLVLRLRGNEVLIGQIVAKTDWTVLLELLR